MWQCFTTAYIKVSLVCHNVPITRVFMSDRPNLTSDACLSELAYIILRDDFQYTAFKLIILRRT